MARLFSIISHNIVDITFDIPAGTKSNMQGWGVSWYDMRHAPLVKKGKRSVVYQDQNEPVSIAVKTDVFLSHARFASSGAISESNAHPFQFKQYVFAHSGTVHKELLMEKLAPPMSENFQSEPIDSEVFFRYILQSVKQKGIVDGIQEAITTARDPRGTNFLLTDGSALFAYCYGLPLYYLMRKTPAPFHAMSQETGISIGSEGLSRNPAMIIASEKLTNENWTAFDDHELMIVHQSLQYEIRKIL